MIILAKVRRYKGSRKYRCPYCKITATREKLVSHIDKYHQSMLPEGYTSAHALYDYINKKNYGTCLICKSKVYEWDDNICRYKNICDNPNCLSQLKARAQGNHLDDPEVQKKMLAGRRISGNYTFHDGVTHSYVGSYERNCFEFMDTVMNIQGKDIMSPGPTSYYEWNGEKHPWILDWMYIPALLCCDVKDGGSNPNNRPMEDYRARQIAKEEAIAKLGKYNYIRLTDNNFAQLLSAFADIRYGVINHDPINHIYINETVGGIPSHRGSGSDYIIPHMLRNTFTGNEIIFGNTAWDSLVSYDYETKTIPIINPKDDKHLAPIAEDYRLILPSNKIPSMSKEDFSKYTEDTLIEYLTGTPYTGIKELLMEKVVGISSDSESPLIRSLILNGIVEGIRTVISEAINGPIFVKSVGYVSIYRDDNGYYAITPEDYLLKSDSYPDIPDHLIDLMNDLYGAHKLREEDAKHAARSRERQ